MTTFEESTARAGRLQQPPPEESQPLPPVVEPLVTFATRLNNAYYRERQQREICVTDAPSRFNNKQQKLRGDILRQWMKIAEKLQVAGVKNAERFIHAQFMSGPLSYPRQLCGDTAIQKFVIYDKHAIAFMAQDWRSQDRVFVGGAAAAAESYPQYSVRECWDFVLRTSMLDMDPLFRYCIAMSERFFDTAALFYDAALCQLLTDPIGYVNAWRGCIPEALLLEAAAITAIPL